MGIRLSVEQLVRSLEHQLCGWNFRVKERSSLALKTHESEINRLGQFSLGSFLATVILIGSAISLFVVNYNLIWDSVKEPEKHPKLWIILEHHRQFWFVSAFLALFAVAVVPRRYQICMLILFVVALSAGLYNFLVPLGML